MPQPRVEVVATWGTALGGFGRREFKNPSALATDYEGNLIVADTDNHRVVKLDRTGSVLWSVGNTRADDSPCPGTAQGEFDAPQAICIDATNQIFVADTRNCRVQKLSPSGEVLTVFGSWGNQYGQFGGDGPLGIAIDESGMVLVSDSHTAAGGNHRVQKFDTEGHYVGLFGSPGRGSGEFGGDVPIRQYGFDFGPGIGPGPIGPTGIAVNTRRGHLVERNVNGGDIFCADCDGDRILVFRGTGLPAGAFGTESVYRPRQLWLDSRDRLYVSGVHLHEPPMVVEEINDPLKWRIEPEARWVMVFDSGSGRLLGRIGTLETHAQLDHHVGSNHGAGLHSHGYGVAVNRVDESIVYVQGGNLIFTYRVDWDGAQ